MRMVLTFDRIMISYLTFRLWSLRRCVDLGAGACLGAAIALSAQARSEAQRPLPLRDHGTVAAPRGMPATALAVVDGDTFEARVVVFPGQEIVTRVRLAGIDAPERRGRCPAEIAAAEQATSALRALVEGRRLTLTEVRGDKYFGRVIARVGSPAGDVAETLIANGHGRPYEGGRRAGWC